jgi:RHS repeat-associated protein
MTYDATENANLSYDQENRITGANGYAYTYDGDGNRVRKSNGNLAGSGTLYWYMSPGVMTETDLAGTIKSEYVFFDGERVARRDGPTGTAGVFYYFSDHLKTASIITDSAGVIKAESDYYPWGGELQFVNNDSNDYKFTGTKRDSETGLDYFGARYYSTGLGRWVSADWSATPVPVPYADLEDPQTLNLYGYVRNAPTTNTDPDGHACPPCLEEIEEVVEVVAEHPAAAATVVTVAEKTGEVIEVGAQIGVRVIATPLIVLNYLFNPGTGGGEREQQQEQQAAQNESARQKQKQQAIEARKSSKTIRREWEKKKDKKWPKDKDGNNYDADHKRALADGGSNNVVRNIQPRSRKDHINRHKKNGDFRRWAKRRTKTS